MASSRRQNPRQSQGSTRSNPGLGPARDSSAQAGQHSRQDYQYASPHGYLQAPTQTTFPAYGSSPDGLALTSTSSSLCFPVVAVGYNLSGSYENPTIHQHQNARSLPISTSGYHTQPYTQSSTQYFTDTQSGAQDTYGSQRFDTTYDYRQTMDPTDNYFTNTYPQNRSGTSASSRSAYGPLSPKAPAGGSEPHETCPSCGQDFTGKCAVSNRKRHEKEQHDDQNKIECRICRTPFTRNDYRRKHEDRCSAILVPLAMKLDRERS